MIGISAQRENIQSMNLLACSLLRLLALLALLLGAIGLGSLLLDAVELLDHESSRDSTTKSAGCKQTSLDGQNVM